jgi:adenylate cyclase
LALRDLARFVEDQIQMTDMVSLQETLIASRRETKEAHDFIRQAFGRFVAEDVADSILKSPESLNLGGAKRRVTVMFSDLRGFTRLSETLPPEDVVGLLNRYFTVMVDIIIKYGGTIDSFIGDAILVVFGAPRDGSENAASALA